MRFKHPHLEKEFHERLHPNVRTLLILLEHWSEDNDIPGPIISAISRAPEWYDQNGLKRPPYSWHYCDAAADLRDKHYTTEQYAKVVFWLAANCPTGPWELITDLHGTGKHLHVGARDFRWRAAWEKRNQPKPGVIA